LRTIAEKNKPPFTGTGVAVEPGAMRKLSSVLIVACVVVGTAFVSTAPQRHWRDKVDPALVQAAKQNSGEPVKALIRLRSGSTTEFVSHLSQHGIPVATVTADVVSVQLPASMLREIALDRDVVHLSLP
jgi:hypothetical protein